MSAYAWNLRCASSLKHQRFVVVGDGGLCLRSIVDANVMMMIVVPASMMNSSNIF